MQRQLKLFSLIVLLFGSLTLAGCGGPYEFKGLVANPVTNAPDFTLTNFDGTPWTLSQQRGKAVMVFFGFTYCPDICPTALSDLAKVRKSLGDQANKMEVAFITVDPDRDTAQRMQKYVGRFDSTFVGLTGSTADLQKVYKLYGVTANKVPMPGSALQYSVEHTGLIYTVDPTGKLKVVFTPDMSVDDMTSDTRALLQQGAA